MTKPELQQQIEALRASLAAAPAEDRKTIMDQIAVLSHELRAMDDQTIDQ